MSEKIIPAVFQGDSKQFAAGFRSMQYAGDGGTSVTIDGEVQGTFAADVYIAARLAELVAQSPETLNTLAELAAALGNDPNFATTIMEMLGQKLDKAAVAAGNYYLYGVHSDGVTQKMYYLGYAPMAGRVPLYDTDGQLRVGFAVREDAAVPLAQMNEALGGKLDVSTLLNKVYGTGNEGEQKLFAVSGGADGNTIAYRGANGRLNVGVATNETNAVPLGQLNEMLAAQVGDIAAALDEVHAYAQALVTGGNTQ